jgi:hypothetical protein
VTRDLGDAEGFKRFHVRDYEMDLSGHGHKRQNSDLNK